MTRDRSPTTTGKSQGDGPGASVHTRQWLRGPPGSNGPRCFTIMCVSFKFFPYGCAHAVDW